MTIHKNGGLDKGRHKSTVSDKDGHDFNTGSADVLIGTDTISAFVETDGGIDAAFTWPLEHFDFTRSNSSKERAVFIDQLVTNSRMHIILFTPSDEVSEEERGYVKTCAELDIPLNVVRPSYSRHIKQVIYEAHTRGERCTGEDNFWMFKAGISTTRNFVQERELLAYMAAYLRMFRYTAHLGDDRIIQTCEEFGIWYGVAP